MKMNNSLQLSQILLVLILRAIATKATFVQNTFKKLDPEQNITGTISVELKARSHQECALM